MSDLDQTPTFNLKVVVRETGLKPDTLRVWERRYGLPQPERTPGGHRLYSQQDIETLKWLVARQQEGLSISRAVKLWRQLEADGQDPLQVTPSLSAEPEEVVVSPAVGDALLELRQAWVAACLDFDQARAEQILNQAFALYSVETVCTEVMQAGLVEIGQGWYESTNSVQQEHFTSELMVRRLEALIVASPMPTRSGRILLACPPEEEHTLSSLLLNLFLRRRGWDIVYLGANVPIERLQATVTAVRPNLVVLVAQRLPTAASLLEMGRALQDMQVPLAFGGLIFNRLPALRSRIPGYFLGEGLEDALRQIEQWLASGQSLPPRSASELADSQHGQALAHYLDQQGAIEAEVRQMLGQDTLSADLLSRVNQYMAAGITAALKLGDIGFLSADITWVEGLLNYHHIPPEVLAAYLAAYYRVAKNHLDEPGQLIVDWLARQMDHKEE